MSFWLKTTNSLNDIRGKKFFLGTDLENSQLPIWGTCLALALFVCLQGDVSLFWKIVTAAVAVLTAARAAKLTGWRTAWQLLRMAIAKKRNGEIAVNRGADRSYFKPNATNGRKN